MSHTVRPAYEFRRDRLLVHGAAVEAVNDYSQAWIWMPILLRVAFRPRTGLCGDGRIQSGPRRSESSRRIGRQRRAAGAAGADARRPRCGLPGLGQLRRGGGRFRGIHSRLSHECLGPLLPRLDASPAWRHGRGEQCFRKAMEVSGPKLPPRKRARANGYSVATMSSRRGQGDAAEDRTQTLRRGRNH